MSDITVLSQDGDGNLPRLTDEQVAAFHEWLFSQKPIEGVRTSEDLPLFAASRFIFNAATLREAGFTAFADIAEEKGEINFVAAIRAAGSPREGFSEDDVEIQLLAPTTRDGAVETYEGFANLVAKFEAIFRIRDMLSKRDNEGEEWKDGAE